MTAAMNNLDDAELLRQYAHSGSEEAFSVLAHRHINLIYSAALRRVRDPHLAEDVTQAVFLILARRAQSISPGTILAAWLYKSTRYASANAMKIQRRRAIHEQAAATLPRKEPRMDANWQQIGPVLEDAMDSLRTSDRELILLRFFQNQTVGDISTKLGISDNTAAKRLSRAVDRLRSALSHRGVTASAAGLTVVLSEQAVRAAPSISISANAVSASSSSATEIAAQVIHRMVLSKAALISLAAGIAAMLPVTAVIFAQAQGAKAPAPQSPATTQAAASPLDRVLPSVRLDNVAMSDVMEFLHDVSGITFNVNWNALADVHILPSSPVTARGQNITLGNLLALIFGQFPNAADRIKIQTENGIISITATAK